LGPAVGIAREPEEVAERQPELEETERCPDELGVRRRVPHLPIDGPADPDPFALHRLDQRCRDATRRREVLEVQRSLILADLAASFGDSGRKVGIRVGELPSDDPPDRLERQTLPLEIADPTDPLGMDLVVPGDASLTFGLWQEVPRLVVANRVHRDVAGGGQLLDAVPHDRSLYECALEPSHRPLASPPAPVSGLRCAA
jgi:hypothetical protein